MAEQRSADSDMEKDTVIKDTMSLESLREGMPEEEGYDVPFTTFTWRHWLATQARVQQCFSRFVRAVERKRADHAIMIGLEMQEIATMMLLEAYALCADLPLRDLPRGEFSTEKERVSE